MRGFATLHTLGWNAAAPGRPGAERAERPRGTAARPWALPGPGSTGHHAARGSLGHGNADPESLLLKRVRENTRSSSAGNAWLPGLF